MHKRISVLDSCCNCYCLFVCLSELVLFVFRFMQQLSLRFLSCARLKFICWDVWCALCGETSWCLLSTVYNPLFVAMPIMSLYVFRANMSCMHVQRSWCVQLMHAVSQMMCRSHFIVLCNLGYIKQLYY